MSANTEIQYQVRTSTGCDKCDAEKLLYCRCRGNRPEKNEPEEKEESHLGPTAGPLFDLSAAYRLICAVSFFGLPGQPTLLLCGPQDEFEQFMFKPGVKVADIKKLLELFILVEARNHGVDVTSVGSIKALGKTLGIDYDDTRQKSLDITFEDPECCAKFSSELSSKHLIESKQEQAQTENITSEGDDQGSSFSASPFN